MHNAHHLNLELSQAQSTSLMASCSGTTKVTGLSMSLNVFSPFFPAFPTILISLMPSPVAPPHSGRCIQLEKGRENFSPAKNKVLQEYLDDFRSKNKEERKQLLMFKIYRLIKAVGPELDGDQWRARKRVSGYCCLGEPVVLPRK